MANKCFIQDIKIFPEAPLALKQLKEMGYKLIVITNQAVIARGGLTEKGMEALHLEYNALLLQRGGAAIGQFYFCPHHPKADVEAYRTICGCRKPAHGLILQAARENNIDLKQSWMIGDKLTDIVAGKNAGCKTILIRTPTSYETNVSGVAFDKNTKADYEVANLIEATHIVSRASGK